ncbi:FUSC family protein [Pantoea agglomerans]
MMAGHFPGNSEDALIRGGLTGLGALVQLFFLVFFAGNTVLCKRKVLPSDEVGSLSDLHRLHLRWSVLFAAPAVAAALVIAEHAGFFSGYWAGMTLLLCMRSHYRESLFRVPARIIGTVGGVCLASGLSELNQSHVFTFTAFIMTGYLAVSYSFSLGSRSYMTFTFLVSLMVIFLMQSQQQDQAGSRIFATLAGGLCALAALFCSYMTAKVYLHWRRKISVT